MYIHKGIWPDDQAQRDEGKVTEIKKWMLNAILMLKFFTVWAYMHCVTFMKSVVWNAEYYCTTAVTKKQETVLHAVDKMSNLRLL